MNATVPPRTLPAVSDRRRHARFRQPALTLSINGTAATILDVSVGGLRAAIQGFKPGQKVSVALAVTLDGSPRTIEAAAQVVAANGGQVSLSFSAPTYALMHFIVNFLAARHGVEPHTFR